MLRLLGVVVRGGMLLVAPNAFRLQGTPRNLCRRDSLASAGLIWQADDNLLACCPALAFITSVEQSG